MDRSGHKYRFDQWRDLLEDARQRKFNAVCATIGDLRWFAQVAPEQDFKRSQPRREVTRSLDPLAHDAVIIERAAALTAEKPVTADTIARVLLAEGFLSGTVSKTIRSVITALRRSGRFIARDAGDSQPPVWERWTPKRSCVEHPDGSRTITMQVLSTQGVPVNIEIPIRPVKDIAEMLLREVLADRKSVTKRHLQNNRED